jgi:hypothetical protein
MSKSVNRYEAPVVRVRLRAPVYREGRWRDAVTTIERSVAAMIIAIITAGSTSWRHELQYERFA